jgi:carotenoid cleavage dioxygenase-like enzyme
MCRLAFHGHTAGCYENEDGHVVIDLTVADGNVFFWFPPDGQPPKRDNFSSPTMRWVLDPKAPTHTRIEPTLVWPINGEFSRIDDRFTTKKYKHFWQAMVDPSRPYDFPKCGPPAGGLFNCLGHFTWDMEDEKGTGTSDVYFAGPTMTFQEPTFIPRTGGAEGEGYLIALLNHLDVLRNDVVIFDAQHMAKGPVATIHLPLKLKLGLHGNFVDHRDIEAWQKRRDARTGDVGPVKVATEPLPWQKKMMEEGESEQAKTNGTNGVARGITEALSQAVLGVHGHDP